MISAQTLSRLSRRKTAAHPASSAGQAFSGSCFSHFRPPSTRIHARAFRGAIAPGLCLKPEALGTTREQGMPGARSTRSLARENNKAHELVTAGTPGTPGIPRAMVLTAYSELSLVNRAFLPPSPRNAEHCRELTPASGRLLPAFRSSCATLRPHFHELRKAQGSSKFKIAVPLSI
jgi:hypothetical protein